MNSRPPLTRTAFRVVPWLLPLLLAFSGCLQAPSPAVERGSSKATANVALATAPSPTSPVKTLPPTSPERTSDVTTVAAAPKPPSPNPEAASTEASRRGDAPPCLLLAVGDSLTDPKSAGGGYLKAVTLRCGCQVVNLGRGGDMVNQMKRRLIAHLSSTKNHYSDVLIFGGVNDLYSDETAHRTVAKISGDLTQMYEQARAAGSRVIALTVSPWGGFRRYYTPKRARTTRELNAFILSRRDGGQIDVVVDAYSVLSCPDSENHPENREAQHSEVLCPSLAVPFKDGLHFGPKGHQALGEALVKALGTSRCPERPDH